MTRPIKIDTLGSVEKSGAYNHDFSFVFSKDIRDWRESRYRQNITRHRAKQKRK